MTLVSFIIFLALFLAVGLGSAFVAKGTRKDYYLAGSSVPPWLVALSAVATNNSGYMFIGVIGYTYVTGLASIWLMVGWILGDFVASLFIHKKLREATGDTHEASFAGVIAAWHGRKFTTWRRVAAMVMIVFLGAYAAAQISAGGKALHGVLGWAPETGAIIVAAMVMVYSIAGGIRASIWTDGLQSLVMMVAMAVLFIVGVNGLGGWSATVDAWDDVPAFMNLFPADLLFPGALGVGLFVLGWMFAGASVIGQPHIMVRFMTLDNADHMTRTRVWYYSYFTIFYLLATGVGMLSRLYLPDLQSLDPELALPTMAVELLPPVMVGVVLAGIFAATMSTADSLVLSCSAAVTHDLMPQQMESQGKIKMATAAVTGLALFIALSDNSSVFSLVILAWSVLASAFAPMLFLMVSNRDITEGRAIIVMLIGVGTALLWREFGFHADVYEGMPAILLALVVGWGLSKKTAS